MTSLPGSLDDAWRDLIELLPADDTGMLPELSIERQIDGCVVVETWIDIADDRGHFKRRQIDGDLAAALRGLASAIRESGLIG